MGLVSRIMEISPHVEVVIRQLYWRSAFLVKLFGKKSIQKTPKSDTASAQTRDKIEHFLIQNGMNPGRLLVAHTSGEALRPMGYSIAELVDWLLALTGPEGTLALPAFPKYRDEPKGTDRITADVSDLELTYDVQKSIPWTGVLPLNLMKRKQAERSQHPLNSMTALGPLAKPMMAHNLVGELPLPCGPNSSWKFCADQDALIVALGVDMAHSLTMIHVAEDCHAETWPVKNWYRPRKFKVIDGDVTRHVKVGERHPKWSMHYAERTLSKDLRVAGIMKRAVIDDILVEVIGSKDLLAFLDARKAAAYPYFFIPPGAGR